MTRIDIVSIPVADQVQGKGWSATEMPNVPVSGGRLVLDSLDANGYGGTVVVGAETWNVSIAGKRRATTTISLAAGDANVDISAGAYWGTPNFGKLTIEALFSQPIPANDPFQITDLTSMGNSPTIVAKHITELVLGP